MAFELRDITLNVGQEAHLSDICAQFHAGSFNVLLGPTLAGKTSLMRIMAGLDQPTHGSIMMNGVDVTGVPVRKRSVAFVYQQFINYPSMTVFSNIASPLKIAGHEKHEIEERVIKIATLLGIEGMLERKPLELSGGQQQRVALARALVREADLVLLDEPLANLDYKLREELRSELPKLFRETGSIVVYATTEPEEALLLGGQTTLLHEGRALQSDSTMMGYREPKTLQAAQTFSDPPFNVAPAQCAGGEMAFCGTSYALKNALPDGAYQVGFRAHQLKLAKKIDAMIEISAVIQTTEITGSESFLHLSIADMKWTALVHGVHHFKPGQTVTLYLDPFDLYIFDMAGNRIVDESALAEASVG